MEVGISYPRLRQVVLDTTHPRALAEFYRQLLGHSYRPGDQPSPDKDEADLDWLVLVDESNGARIAFQQVEVLPEPTWPQGPRPQMLHLDLTVPSPAALAEQHERVLGLGGRLLLDRFDDPDEPLRVYADPSGHPFCIFVAPTPTS